MNIHHGPAILKVLQANDSPKSSDALATALGVEPVEIRASLHRMRVEGEVVREIDYFNRYTYRLPNKVATKAPVMAAVKIATAEVAEAAEVTAAVEVPAEPKAPRNFAHNGPKPDMGGRKPGRTELILQALTSHGPRGSGALVTLTGLAIKDVSAAVNYLLTRKRVVITDNKRPWTYGLPTKEPVQGDNTAIASHVQRSLTERERGERGLAGKLERAQALSPAVANAVQRAAAERDRWRDEMGVELGGLAGKVEPPFQNSISQAAIEADASPNLKQRLDAASATFAAALGVPESVMQCTYIAAQIDSVISKLDRPANAVLADLIGATQHLRNASAALAKDFNPIYSQSGATP